MALSRYPQSVAHSAHAQEKSRDLVHLVPIPVQLHHRFQMHTSVEQNLRRRRGGRRRVIHPYLILIAEPNLGMANEKGIVIERVFVSEMEAL